MRLDTVRPEAEDAFYASIHRLIDSVGVFCH